MAKNWYCPSCSYGNMAERVECHNCYYRRSSLMAWWEGAKWWLYRRSLLPWQIAARWRVR
jgi:hypothetical protein